MPKLKEYTGPLVGLNVVDFGHYYAGPMAAMLLADQGANVIHIVKPGKVELPDQQYRLFNRNKKLLELDLKSEEGKAQALSLVENADVLIENFRPGVMKRLELDYASVKEKNSGLVYLSLPGFASNDKERAHLQAWEGVLAAAAGLFTELSLYRSLLKFPPVYTAMPVCSIYGAVHGATAVTAALIAREEHGHGTVIEVPLATCGLMAISRKFFDSDVHRFELPETYKPLVYKKPAAGVDRNVNLETQLKKASQKSTHIAYTFFPCSDDRTMVIVVAGKWLVAIGKLLGINEKLYVSGLVSAGGWNLQTENNIDTMANTSIEVVEEELSPERRKLRRRFFDLIAEGIRKLPSDECEELLRKAGVPCSILRTREEWLQMKPLLDSGVLACMDNGNTELTVPGRLVDIGGPNGAPMSTQISELGPVTMEKARALFANRMSVPSPQGNNPKQKKGDLLKGVKVLDLGNILAGPIGAHILAEYGADVIKSDSWAYGPGLIKMIIELNQGKRSILNDVKTGPGREIFENLVRWADIVTHNILDDTGLRLGVTPRQLEEINPELISCQISAYGGPYRGHWENYTGFDHTLSAAAGLMTRYGGSIDFPQFHGRVASGDVLGGAATAFAALLGIYQKKRTGYAGEGRTSLARAVSYTQFPWMISEQGNSDWGEPHGQLALGPSPWQRLYECKNRWIYVGTSEDKAAILAKIVTDMTSISDEALQAAFIKADSGHWINKLALEGIVAYEVSTAADIKAAVQIRVVSNNPEDEVAEGTFEILRWTDHPSGSPIEQVASDQVRIGEDKSWLRLAPASRLGEHTEEILREFGFSDEKIADYLRVGACFNYYLPLGDKKSFFTPGDWK